MRWLTLLILTACGGAPADKPTDSATPTEPCFYPEGAVDPMELDGVIPAFSWPQAIRMSDAVAGSLDLVNAHCDTDPLSDWSPHDVLLFVSIPAW
jgi:hypothetical protein